MIKQQRGSTLIGALVMMSIAVTTITIILGGFVTSSRGVAIVSQRITAENYAREQIETIKADTYRANPTTVPYAQITTLDHYTVDIIIGYWITPDGPFAASVQGQDSGLQAITVSVYSTLQPDWPLFTVENYKGIRR